MKSSIKRSFFRTGYSETDRYNSEILGGYDDWFYNTLRLFANNVSSNGCLQAATPNSDFINLLQVIL